MAIATTPNRALPITPKTRERIAEMLPEMTSLIDHEYAEVSVDDVRPAAERGDTESVIDTIAKMTGHTRNLVTHQLKELAELHSNQSAESDLMHKMSTALQRIEARSKDALTYAKEELPDEIKATGKKAKATVEDNVWVSILCAIGLGFVVGFFAKSAR